MRGIQKFNIRDFKYGELLEFAEKVNALMPEPYRSETPFIHFYHAYENFKEALDTPGNTEQRQELAEADALVCKASHAFRTMLMAGILHPDPRVVKAAEQIQQLMPKLANPKRLDRKSLLETAKVTLERLRTLPEELLQIFSQLQPYQEQLKNNINIFLELQRQNAQIKLKTKHNNMCYRELTKSWRVLRNYINLKVLQSNPAFEEIAQSINKVIQEMISRSSASSL